MRRFLAAIALLAVLAAPAAAQTGFGTPNFNTLSLNGVTATGFGTAVGQVPLFINSQGSGFPGLIVPGRLILFQAAPAAGDFGVLQVNRTTTFTGGSTISGAIRVIENIGQHDTNQNWGIVSAVNTAGTDGGGIVGGFMQGTKNVGATSVVIAGISDAIDLNIGASSLNGAQVVGHEIDVEGFRLDDGPNGAVFGGSGVRVALNIVAVRHAATDVNQFEVGQGVWFSSATLPLSGSADALTNYKTAIGFAINTQIHNALDTRGAVPIAGSSDPVLAVVMSQGHVIDFKGGASLKSAPGRYLSYDGSNFKYSVSGTDFFYVSDNGRIGVQAAPETQVAFAIGGTGMVVGIDVSAATLSGNAIRLAAGQTIAMDASGVHTLFYDTGSGKLFYAVGGVNKFSIDASGNVRAAGTLTPSVTP